MRIRLSVPPDKGNAMTSEEAGCEPERDASPTKSASRRAPSPGWSKTNSGAWIKDTGHRDRPASSQRAPSGRGGRQPQWRDVAAHPHIARTPIGRLVTMDAGADATEFLLPNTGVNAHDLIVEGGYSPPDRGATANGSPDAELAVMIALGRRRFAARALAEIASVIARLGR
jgi:hypothetical protein